MLNDYEFKNEFADNSNVVSNLKSFIYKIITDLEYYHSDRKFIEEISKDYKVLCWKFLDGRTDCVGRRIFSFFGVAIDVKDVKYDTQQFISKIEKSISLIQENNSSSFELANSFPIIWNKEKQIPNEMINSNTI